LITRSRSMVVAILLMTLGSGSLLRP
jgi:hypothetical protein